MVLDDGTFADTNVLDRSFVWPSPRPWHCASALFRTGEHDGSTFQKWWKSVGEGRGGRGWPSTQDVLEQMSLRKEHMWKLNIWKVTPLTVHAADLCKCWWSPVQLDVLMQHAVFHLQPFASLFHWATTLFPTPTPNPTTTVFSGLTSVCLSDLSSWDTSLRGLLNGLGKDGSPAVTSTASPSPVLTLVTLCHYCLLTLLSSLEVWGEQGRGPSYSRLCSHTSTVPST